MAMNTRRGFLLLGLLLIITCTVIFFVPQRDEPTVPNTEADSHSAAETGIEVFSGFPYDNADDLVAGADRVVLGRVAEVSEYGTLDEYAFEVMEQFKGETDDKTIHVYENKGTLLPGGTYILFLSVTEGAYYPHPIHTSIAKDAILAVSENGEIAHGNGRLDKNKPLKEWKALLHSSKGKDVIATKDKSRGLARVKNEKMPLNQMTEEADLIAVISAKSFVVEYKYHKIAEAEVKEVYKDLTGIEKLHTAQFVMPPSMETGKDYLVFMQHKQGILYTLTLEGSMISQDDPDQWEQATAFVKRAIQQP